jgi:sterol desaturase/sphingolipid hydroxylase (fatty acid hydroxylase superfamily)
MVMLNLIHVFQNEKEILIPAILGAWVLVIPFGVLLTIFSTSGLLDDKDTFLCPWKNGLLIVILWPIVSSVALMNFLVLAVISSETAGEEKKADVWRTFQLSTTIIGIIGILFLTFLWFTGRLVL